MIARRIKKRRYLRPTKFGRKSKIFYVFDTETGVTKGDEIEWTLSARPEHLIFAAVYGVEKIRGKERIFKKVFWSSEEIQNEFKKKKYKGKIIYAHNAEYDLSATFGNIYKLDKEAIFNGKFIACGNGVCKFADSFNLLPTKVEKLGELLGLPKLSLGVDMKSNKTNLVKEIAYCIRDCEIVHKSLQELFSHAEPSFTIGALSLKNFRANFLKKTIKVNGHSDRFFDALYGGRTEAFKIGKCEAYVFDKNSAYPWAMDKQTFPNPAKLQRTTEPMFSMYGYEGMITCTVKVDESETIPVLPYRQDSRLIFPCGTFTGSWTFPEFNYAIANSKTELLKIHQIIYAPAIQSPFSEYIQHYYTKRNETNNEFRRYYYKLFMNNLYGKLIQRAREEYRFCESEKEAREIMKQKKLKSFELIEVQGGYFMRYDIEKIFNHTIACWGSYITSYVRIDLHKQLREEGSNLVYCDTDSYFTNRDSNRNDKNLGGWKKENKIVTRVRALKDYVYLDEKGDEKQMLKGVRKNWKQLDPEANVFKGERMIRTRESFRRVDNLPPGTFIEQIKVLTGDYKKRTVLPNGETKPFLL